jgi:hypothetical protein
MKLLICLIAAAGSLQVAWAIQPTSIYQHGTVVRMRMTDCMAAHHGFMASMSGVQGPMVADSCPEYTLLSDKVVYVIVGESTNQFIPLADVIDFRLHKSEVVVRLDDAKRESKFGIREMILRQEWDLMQKHVMDRLGDEPRAFNGVLTTQSRH